MRIEFSTEDVKKALSYYIKNQLKLTDEFEVQGSNAFWAEFNPEYFYGRYATTFLASADQCVSDQLEAPQE